MHEVKPEQAMQYVGSEPVGPLESWRSLGRRLAAVSLALTAVTPFSFAQSTPGASSSPTVSPSNTHVVPAIPELSPSNIEAEAIFKLANRLEAGDATLARDDVLARRLYRIAADSGHAGAQCNLGAMLMDGTGGPTDLAGGAALFRKAALRGHGLAQYNLGVMHALGDGVIKDSGEAMAWIEQAITRLPEGEAMTSAKAWREHLRNRMSSREGMIARNRSQELGDAIVRELAAASTGSASRAARSALRSGLDELGLSAEALQRLGLPPSATARVGGTGAAGGSGLAGSVATGSVATSSVATGSVATGSVATGSSSGVVRGANRASSQAAIVALTPGAPSAAPTIPVETALQEWLRAWRERRVEDYLNFYDPRYAPAGGVDRSVWAKQRRAAIRHPNWVKVNADQINTTEMSPEEVVVGFVQVYSASTGHRERTRKSMIWRWSDGHWRIVSEQAATVSAKTDQMEPRAPIESTLPVEPTPAVEQKPQSEPKRLTQAQRDAGALQSRAQRGLEAAQAALEKARQEADAAQARANQEAEVIQARARRDAELAQVKAQRDAELAAERAKRDAELANVRAEVEVKQAAAKAAREAQLSAEKTAREAELAANQAKREAETAAASARKEEKRLARTPVPALPATPMVSPPAVASVAPLASAVPAVTAPNSAAFESSVRAWVKAWSDRQVDAYLAFYAPGFEVPGGQDRATWTAQQRESITRPAWIKVRADHLKTSIQGDTAEARFFQVYVVAPGTVELTNKTMHWAWADERWQIVREQSEPVLRKRPKK